MRRGGAGKKRDSSEPAIIDALTKVGAVVKQLHGDGLPDLLVLFQSRWLPIEVKSSGGRVQENQQLYPIARTPEDALQLIFDRGKR